MEITNRKIEEYQKIYKKQYGKNVSKKDAEEGIKNLIGFFSLLLKIDRRLKEEKNNKNKNENNK